MRHTPSGTPYTLLPAIERQVLVRLKRYCGLILLLPLVLAANPAPPADAAAGGVRITFQTNPPIAQIRPHGGPTGHIEPEEAIIEVRDAQGALIPNVQIDFQMIAPPTNWFISTDVPRVEGVTLLDDHFVSATGRQTFNYIFPIRGAYHLTVRARPVTPGTFDAATQTFDVTINEKESSLRNLIILVLVLLAFGAVSGFVLARSHLAARAVGSREMNVSGSVLSWRVLAVVVVAWLAFLVLVEVVEASGTQTRLQAAHLAETVNASSPGARLYLSIAAPSPITPSQPATLSAHLTDANGAPIQAVHYDVSVVQMEDVKTVFAASTDSVDGAINWTHDFWDGTDHMLKVVASPSAGSAVQFAPVTLEHVVGVIPLSPPLRVKLLGTLYFLVVMTLGTLAGTLLARRSAVRHAATA